MSCTFFLLKTHTLSIFREGVYKVKKKTIIGSLINFLVSISYSIYQYNNIELTWTDPSEFLTTQKVDYLLNEKPK